MTKSVEPACLSEMAAPRPENPLPTIATRTCMRSSWLTMVRRDSRCNGHRGLHRLATHGARALAFEPALAQSHHALAQGRCVVAIVRHQERGDAQLADHCADLARKLS